MLKVSGLGIIAGVCLFIAFEQKAVAVMGAPFALYLLFAGYCARIWSDSARYRLTKLCIFGFIASAVCFPLVHTLLYSTAKYGGRYIDIMHNVGRYYSVGESAEWWKHFVTLFNSFGLLPGAYFHRNYPLVLVRDYPLNYSLGHSFVLVVVAGLCAIFLTIGRRWRDLNVMMTGQILTAACSMLISRSQGSWAGHHTIFAHIIPITATAVALGALLRRRLYLALAIPSVCMLLYTSLQATWFVVHSRPENFSDPSRDTLLKLVDNEDFAKQHLVLHLSWGSYFLDSLFGPPSQAVVRHNQVSDDIRLLASNNHRRLAVLKIHEPGWGQSAEARGLHLHAAPAAGQWELWVQD